MKAPAWSQVRLRVSWGDMPEFSDILEFKTGRRYQVIGIKGKGLTCLVLPPEAPTDGCRVLPWCWAPRNRGGRR